MNNFFDKKEDVLLYFLDKEISIRTIVINELEDDLNILNTQSFYSDEELIPQNKTPKSLWHDIHLLCDLEKHLRNGVTMESMNLITVDINSITEKLEEKFIDKIEDPFWKEYGYVLVVFVIRNFSKDGYGGYLNSVLDKIKGPFKKQILDWIEKRWTTIT